MIKNKTIFSKGVSQAIRQASNFEGLLPVKYLGIPLHSKRLQVMHYQPIVDKIKKKIEFYGMNTLSLAGRAKLINYVVMLLTFYWFQVLKFPAETIKHIDTKFPLERQCG